MGNLSLAGLSRPLNTNGNNDPFDPCGRVVTLFLMSEKAILEGTSVATCGAVTTRKALAWRSMLVLITTVVASASWPLLGEARATAPLPSVALAPCFSRDLSRGSRGNDVALLQAVLVYLNVRPGPVDGIFGNATRLAWKRWERIIGLRADGIATVAELSWGACAAPSAGVVAIAPGAVVPEPAIVEQGQVPVAGSQIHADTVVIDAIGMERPIVVGYSSQGAINACQGAVLFAGGWPGGPTGTYLAAHRTSCGSMGFEGVQSLPAGTVVQVRHNGLTSRFAVQSVSTATVGGQLMTPAAGVLVLQTSRAGNEVWVVTATAIG